MKNNKILATLAVLAMVFVGVAVYADQADAEGENGTTTPDATTLSVGRTMQVVYTLPDAATTTNGVTVNWTVSEESNLKFLVDGASATEATSTTNVFGKAYITVVGIAAGSSTVIAAAEDYTQESAGITVSALGANQLATWAVVAATNNAAPQDDPVAAPADASSRMYVFQYTNGNAASPDNSLMIDTKYMTNLNGVANVYVGLTYDESETIIGPLANQEKIFVDLKGNYNTAANGTVTSVRLYSYDGNGTTIYPLSASVDIAVVHDSSKSGYTLASLALVPQYKNDIEGDHSDAAVTYTNLVRNESFALNQLRSAELVRSGYELVAWSHNSKAVDGSNNGNGSKDIVLNGTVESDGKSIASVTLPIEEILMLVTQAAPATGTATDAPAWTAMQTDKVTSIYGVWQKTFYTIEYIDPAASAYSADPYYAVNADDGTPIVAAVADVSGSTIIGGEETSFGIISVIKRDASKDNDYTYMFQIFKEDGTTSLTGDKYYYASQLKTLDGFSACQIEQVNNGTWKIHHVTQNIKIAMIAVKTTALETGVDFAINFLKNNTTASTTTEGTFAQAGQARLSLDLNDYPAVAGQDIYMKGTYYRVLTDLNGVRVYGNIENLTVREAAPESEESISTFERQYTAYIDSVVQTVSYEESAVTKETNVMTGSVLTTPAPDADYPYIGGHSYDLVLKTKDKGGFYLYGVQGVWDTNGATAAGVVYTPWSIYEDNSDGQ